ncbi:TadE family type IV pilus minor pilin [Parafrigoribacterium humi]|jgi:Flp pilus assembly protein TadG|uniref:TadE family type IV pilus minor pilin n=1 Tax=Parafrigoribacterium humi TaxID=3144664 RepID=UPI0032EF4AA2
MRSVSPAERAGHDGRLRRTGGRVGDGHDDAPCERGSVTAEFATVIPAVLLVLACCLGGVQLVSQQLRLQDAAAAASRILSRGEGAGTAYARAAQLVRGAHLERTDRGGMVCVRLATSGPAGIFAAVRVEAASCALAAGQ